MSKYQKSYAVPDAFPKLLKEFTREVLRHQPQNIYEFGASYFRELSAKLDQEKLMRQQRQDSRTGGAAESVPAPGPQESVSAVLLKLFQGQKFVHCGDVRDILSAEPLSLSPYQASFVIATLAEIDDFGYLDAAVFAQHAPTVIEEIQQTGFLEHFDYDEDALVYGQTKEEIVSALSQVFGNYEQEGQSGVVGRAALREILRSCDSIPMTTVDINVFLIEADENDQQMVHYVQSLVEPAHFLLFLASHFSSPQ